MQLEQLPKDLQRYIAGCIKHCSMTIGNELEDALTFSETVDEFKAKAKEYMQNLSVEALSVAEEIKGFC